MNGTEPSAKPSGPSRAMLLALIAIGLAAELAALSWIDARPRIGATQDELERRLRAIEGLKSLPAVDFPAMSVRIDGVIAAVDSLPLAFEERGERPVAPQAAASAAERGFFARLGAEVWHELSQLIVVRRIGAAEPP